MREREESRITPRILLYGVTWGTQEMEQIGRLRKVGLPFACAAQFDLRDSK